MMLSKPMTRPISDLEPAMPDLHCRQCGAQVNPFNNSCTSCGCTTPVVCATCKQPMALHHLSQMPSPLYPYGSFSPESEPLCSRHQILACHGCGTHLPSAKMTETLVEYSPIGEEIFARICGRCISSYRPPRRRPHFGIIARDVLCWAAVLIPTTMLLWHFFLGALQRTGAQ